MLLKYLFYACIFTLSLGQLTTISKSSTTSFYLFDIIVGFFACYGCFYFILIKKSLKLPPTFLYLGGFSFVALIALLARFYFLDVSSFVVSAFYLFRWSLYLVASFVIFNMLYHNLIQYTLITRAFLISALLVSIIGFIQLLVLPDFQALDASLGWDPHKNRLASTFFDPNFVGGYLVLCLIVGVVGNTNLRSLLPRTIPVLIAIFLTFSRSSWLMLAFVLLVYGIFKWRLLLLLALCTGFLAYFAVPRVQTRLTGITDPADSAHFRLISWKNTLNIVQDHLFLGVGFNTFRYVQKDYGFFAAGSLGGHSGAGSDSSFLLVLATTGIVGTLFFTVGFFYPIFKVWYSADVMSKLFIVTFLGSLFIHCQFVNSLFYPQILFLWLSFGVLSSYLFSRT